MTQFTDRQNQYSVKKGDLATYEGNCYPRYRCRFHHNKGGSGRRRRHSSVLFLQQQQRKPAGRLPSRAIKEIYAQLPDSAKIVYSCSTGYGEALIKAALHAG